MNNSWTTKKNTPPENEDDNRKTIMNEDLSPTKHGDFLILQTSLVPSPLPFPPCQRTKDHAGYLTEVFCFFEWELTGEACGVSLTTFTNLKKIQPCEEQDFWRFLLEVLSPGKPQKWMLIWKKIFGYVRNLQGICFPFLGQEVSWNWCTTTWTSLHFLLSVHHSESKNNLNKHFSYDNNPFKFLKRIRIPSKPLIEIVSLLPLCRFCDWIPIPPASWWHLPRCSRRECECWRHKPAKCSLIMLNGKAGYPSRTTLTLYLLHMGYTGQTATVLSQGYPHFPSDYGHFTKCSTFICSKQMQWLGQINLQLSGFDCKGDWHRYSIYWFTKQEPRSTNLKEMLQTNFRCLYCFLLRSLKWRNSYSFFLNETCGCFQKYGDPKMDGW